MQEHRIMNRALPLYPQTLGTTFKHDPAGWGAAKRIGYRPDEKAEIVVIPPVCDLICERTREFDHAEPMLPMESIILINATLRGSQAKNDEMESMAVNAAICAYCRIKTIPVRDPVRRIDIVA